MNEWKYEWKRLPFINLKTNNSKFNVLKIKLSAFIVFYESITFIRVYVSKEAMFSKTLEDSVSDGSGCWKGHEQWEAMARNETNDEEF